MRGELHLSQNSVSLTKSKDGQSYLHIEGEEIVDCRWRDTGKEHNQSKWYWDPPPDRGSWSRLRNKYRPSDQVYVSPRVSDCHLWSHMRSIDWEVFLVRLKPMAKNDSAFNMVPIKGVLGYDYRVERAG